MSTLNVGIIVSGYPPAYLGGGPIRSIYALARSASRIHAISILTSNRDHRSPKPLDVPSDRWLRAGGVSVYYASAENWKKYWRGLRLLRDRRPDVIYLNSFFSPKYSIIPQLLYAVNWWRGAAVMIAPRGEFSRGALQYGALKKRVYLWLYKLTPLQRRVAWHASTDIERDDIVRMLPGASRIVVRENETELPRVATPPATADPQQVRLVYVSRIVPKKGLDIALRALQDVALPLRFDIYGKFEDAAYARRCRELATRIPPQICVRFHGPLRPSAVRSVFNEADGFVFPTRGENFGHVIAESLSASCPVLTSAETPWSSVVKRGGGAIVTPNTESAWRAAINDYISVDVIGRQEARKAAGRAYAEWRAFHDGPSVFDLYASKFVWRQDDLRL